jgi:hypothetical protein
MKPFSKIVSGGQTGADRAALDWALAHGVPCGGWCPRGRKAEDGPKETESYIQRTEWNVRDSDATILFSIEPTLTGGSLCTMEFARKHGKPHLHLCAGNDTSPDNLRAFFECHDVKVLNVAEPRASTESKVRQFVIALLDEVLGVLD